MVPLASRPALCSWSPGCAYRVDAERFEPFAAKLVIISNNTPPIKKSEIEYYAMLSKTGVHHYTGSECPYAPQCVSLRCDMWGRTAPCFDILQNTGQKAFCV